MEQHLFVPREHQHVPIAIHLERCKKGSNDMKKAFPKVIAHTTYPNKSSFNEISESINKELNKIVLPK